VKGVKMKKLLIILVLLFSCVAWAGDVEDAGAAFDKKDYATAIQKYKAAGIKGDALAQGMVGAMYEEGLGIKKNSAEAVKWYKLAAAQGNASAQINLGLMYDDGKGVVQDYTRAHMWTNLGVVDGNTMAVKYRDIIAAQMTPQQIAEAQKMARECQARNFKNCD
jgi:TPR repeat protein